MARQTSTGPYLVTEAPSLINCRKCGRAIMAATVGGMAVHIDTATLNPVGELAALMQGRSTYNLRGDHLFRRHPEQIRAGDRRLPVLAKHACTDTPPEHIDPAFAEVAVALIVHACGGVIVQPTQQIAHVPPF
jgi:ribosomal protein S27E